MLVTTATFPGSPGVPNEDWSVATPDLIVVLDGATARTDTGCHHGAAWYARALGSAILHRADGARRLDVALSVAISDVADRHRHTCQLDHPGTPSAGVAIVQRYDDRIRWLVLGDVTVVLDSGTKRTVVADHRISRSAADLRAEADRYPIGDPLKDAAMVRMKHAELAARGREYWVAAACPAAARHALTGGAPADSVHQLAVLTDGAARWVDLYRAGSWESVLRVLGDAGPEWFITHLVRNIEQHDPWGTRFPRNKASDDATAVYAELVKPSGGTDASPGAAEQARAELLSRLGSPDLYGDGMLIKQR